MKPTRAQQIGLSRATRPAPRRNHPEPAPTRDEVQAALEAYLAQGGTITRTETAIGCRAALEITEDLTDYEAHAAPNRVTRVIPTGRDAWSHKE